MAQLTFDLTYRDGRGSETLEADFHRIDSKLDSTKDGQHLICGAVHVFRTMTPDRKGFLPEVRIDDAELLEVRWRTPLP
ncbi:MAG: hypothetical protein QOK36_2335 [Gaiellales bacterium]|jgi:hypothetical protein|nr:hypothetical protein [Gaiellales bacterium]